MPKKVSEKTLAELIIEKLGPDEGEKVIKEIDGITSANDLADVLKGYESAGKPEPIFLVWAVEF